MRHRVKKIRFGGGRDANRMLVRKLLVNFFTRGKLETTLSRAKAIRPTVERIVEKSKEKTEANKNCLLKTLDQKKVVNILFDQIGPVFKDKHGGYVRVVKLGQRSSDGGERARIEWTQPVVLESKNLPKK